MTKNCCQQCSDIDKELEAKTMRITMTEEYENHLATGDCPYISGVCERLYCRSHRSLYRLCETAIQTSDGAGQSYYEIKECPICLVEERQKKYTELARNLP